MSAAALMGRIRMMVARAIIAVVDDAASLQMLQVDALADETLDEVERFGTYGLASAPHPGAEAIVLCVGGLRSHAIAIAVEDRRYRLKNFRSGEVALYDDQGQVIHLTRDGILIETSKPVTIKTPHATLDADRVDLGGEGGKAIARVGDPVEGGRITSGSQKVFAG